jgi:hypothetical protein
LHWAQARSCRLSIAIRKILPRLGTVADANRDGSLPRWRQATHSTNAGSAAPHNRMVSPEFRCAPVRPRLSASPLGAGLFPQPLD